jgi:hypothetical protein
MSLMRNSSQFMIMRHDNLKICTKGIPSGKMSEFENY